MRIVVTDKGTIWNHNNPLLERFKNIVLIVCLDGKPVTEKYECFVSPYSYSGLGMDQYGMESRRYHALASVADDLNRKLRYRDDIVFLTDDDPESLYPYCVIRDRNEFNRLHLCAMAPLHFEGQRRINGYRELLGDLNGLKSILYINSNEYLNRIDKDTKMDALFKQMAADYEALIPYVLNGTYNMRDVSYFDFASMSYVPLKSGFEEIDISKAPEHLTEVNIPLQRELSTLGMVIPLDYPEEDDETKEMVERTVARIDGKKICDFLREQRMALAKANGIEFQSVECPSIGPCAGTCAKCDQEAAYLRDKLSEIPETKRRIPDYTLTKWEVW